MPEKRKSSASDSSRRKPWIDPDDAPELTDEMLDRAEYRIDGKVVRRGRPPLGTQPKSSVTLRLDADVLDAYRALGRGWQSQINADLRRVRKLKKA
ncbi:BrnA antitoxin family protein [Rhodopseudomonas palustris]|uniref:BrnA antitoxin family protein n=1 Tax=Rhodopseudomonas palustris TaxID=1076 RepID=UPI0021F291E6|nr:BrnA antitoxin family protein [Rhodopseudomonas palustris]UYO42872.1 BrnA antitoxin family protein [Rhodopseudomonas palustris]